jgi:hypothetical protein
MKTKNTLLFIIIFWAAADKVIAQSLFSLQGFGAIPLNSFSSSGYRSGGGFGLNYLSPTLINRYGEEDNKMSFHLGINSQFAFSGTNEYKVKLAAPQTGMAYYSLKNSSVGLGLTARLILPGTKFRPYAEGFIGRRHFFTAEEIIPMLAHPDYESRTRNRLMKATTNTRGFGAGLMYAAGDFVFFDFGFLYSRGGKGEWARLGSARQEGNVVKFETLNTRTNMLFINLGISFRIYGYMLDGNGESQGVDDSSQDSNDSPPQQSGGLPNKVEPDPPAPKH